jgi:small GTP-binding protein
MSAPVAASFKSVVIGSSAVGKTCILRQFLFSTFDPTTSETLGVQFMSKIIPSRGRSIELQLWDTAGQELFRSVTRGYFRNAAVVFLVFDLSRRDSFIAIGDWLADVREIAGQDVIAVLIGNKNDLANERSVTRDEAEA